MFSNGISVNKEKKAKRKEILEKNKANDGLIKSALALAQPLAPFHAFRHYNRNGLSVYLESGSGDKLSSSVKQYIQNLLKVNMEVPFGAEWPAEEKKKRREMVNPEARYIFVYEAQDVIARNENPSLLDKGSLVGFLQYRFTLEEEIPVLYVYEAQLESRVQGKGLGKFLMQLIELIACKNGMGAVVLTVQKANVQATSFYINKMRLESRQVMKSYAKHLTRKLNPYLRSRKVDKHEKDHDSANSRGLCCSPKEKVQGESNWSSKFGKAKRPSKRESRGRVNSST